MAFRDPKITGCSPIGPQVICDELDWAAARLSASLLPSEIVRIKPAQVIKFDRIVVTRRMHAVRRRPRNHAQADGAIEDFRKVSSPGHPEGKDHLSLGKARHQVLGADRSTYGLDLYLWRYLSKRR
jgi:hypothetical protein